ncbi:MAG: hypothetical protein NC089_10285 [Bacteroides sp.]|nr:hypothetical protein [Bacteroides sp.]MCM1550348.1 hypothetical protein [Clostridium sp.]
MGIDFRRTEIKKHMLRGYFGLEKESLRVTPEGYLAHTRHPFLNNPNMERDFCENQTELITDIAESVDGAWEQLAALQKKAVITLLHLKTGKELLWPFSNPPYIKSEKDIPIASYQGQQQGKERYREYLAEKYGKRKMLFSGIHFNFSFTEELLKADYEQASWAYPDFQTYKNHVYLELTQKLTQYSWLIVYLTAASPVMDGSYFEDKDLGRDVLKNLASPRCSRIGYWNDFDPLLEYDSFESYIQSIEGYIRQGQLKEISELYYPVRLKPEGENTLENLKCHGVNHIELRMLDLNPLEPVGIKKEDLEFLHLLILYLMMQEPGEFYPFEQIMALKNEKRAATFNEDDIWIETGWNTAVPVRVAALQVLEAMKVFLKELDRKELLRVINFQIKKLLERDGRYAVQIRKQFQENYVQQGIKLAQKYASSLNVD